MDLVEDFVNFGSKQVSLVFGEHSSLSKLILSGFGPLVENIDSLFTALESLINFKRNILDTFLSENYDREKLLRKESHKNHFSWSKLCELLKEWLIVVGQRDLSNIKTNL